MGGPGYEEYFRKKLEARDAKPKADSWNRLEAQLESAEKTRRTTKKWWPGIAAACACLLLVFGFLFQSSTDAELVVDHQQKSTQEDSQMQLSSFETASELSESVVRANATDAEENASSHEPLKRSRITVQEMNNSKNSESAWMQQEQAEVLLAKQMKELGLADLLLQEDISDQVLWQKLDEVLAQASKLQERSGQVSDAEIDALLLLAAEDISSNRSNQGAAISAEALLHEVEMELEESFRQRVFDLLKQGLDRTRTAVVNSMQ